MAYNKQTWKDEIPDLTKPIKDASGKQKTDPQTGRPLYELVQEGTRITSARLNHIEDGVEGAHAHMVELSEDIETHASDGVKHLTAAERTAWNAKETPAAAQQKADASLASAKSYTDTQLLTKADKSTTYSKTETDQRIQNVVGAAPAALDTLKEIGDALNNDPNFAATMTTQLAGKVDKIPGKQLSTEDYTSSEKTKLAGLTAGAGGAGSASDAVIGNRTIADTTAPTGDTGTITTLLGWLANMIKSITGKSSWRTAPATTLEAAKTHADDTTRHLTAAERTAWNAKETTGGAQAKADAAEAAAKAASIALSQRNAPNGVAALDSSSMILGQGIKFGADQYVEQSFVFATTHGSSINQKIDYTLASGANVSGFIEVTVTGSWGNQPSQGRLTKRLDIMGSGAGTINRQSTQYTEVSGEIRGLLSISDLYFKDGKWTVTLESRSNNGNSYTTHIKHQGPSGGKQWTQGTLYTGTETTLPLAVQVIPDDTITKSGYLLQKYKLTGDTGSGLTGANVAANANTLLDTGMYTLSTASTNLPIAGNTTVLFVKRFNTTYIMQEAEAYASISAVALVRKYARLSTDGGTTWTAWLEYATLDTSGDISLSAIPDVVQKYSLTKDDGKALQIASGVDLNTVLKIGFYTGNALLNAPGDSTTWFHIIVQTHSGASDGEMYVVQRAMNLTATGNTPAEWIRRRVNGTWGTWASIPNSNLYNAANGIAGLTSGAVLPDAILPQSVTRRVSLVGGAQTSSYRRSVIAFCELTNTNPGLNSYSNGILTLHRSNGASNGQIMALISAEKRYNTTSMAWAALRMGRGAGIFRPCTFTYNGVKYGGLDFYITDAELQAIVFNGETNFPIFGVDYYNNQTSTALNTEIFNSLAYTADTEIFYTNNLNFNGVDMTPDITANANTTVARDSSGNINVAAKIGFSNDDGIEYDDTNNIFYARMDGVLYPIYTSNNFLASQLPKTYSGGSYGFGAAQTAMTTAEFVTLLTSIGAFSGNGYWVSRGSWTYAQNRYISDTGFGSGVHLAGAVVEVIGTQSAYTIRLTCATTSGGSPMANGERSEFVYVNNGPTYSPGWRKIWNSANDGAGSGMDTDLLAGKTLAEVVQGSLAFAVTAGTAPALTASITPAPAALSAGLRVSIKAHAATTGPVTLNLNALGAKSIKKPNGNNPPLAQGGVYTVVYDGTAFILQGEGGEYGTATASDVRLGSTIGTDNGLVTGTLERVFNKNMANMYRSSGETYFLEAYQGKEWIVSDEMTAYHIPDSLSGVNPSIILKGSSILGVQGTYIPPIARAGAIWTSRASSANNFWEAIDYGNGIFVGVSSASTGNTITRSTDNGITWSAVAAPDLGQWKGLAFGNGTFVAVKSGSSGGLSAITSTDNGVTWTTRSTPAATTDWQKVCYGNGLFVAVSSDGTSQVMTSPDGVTWTLRATPLSSRWTNVCYGNGRFVAVSQDGHIMTSDDGITWTARTNPVVSYWRGVCYGNGLFVAVGLSGTYRLMTSPDGITWTARSIDAQSWKAVAFGDGLYVAVSSGTLSVNDNIYTSYDGLTWTSRTAPVAQSYGAIAFGGGIFAALCTNGTGNRAVTSNPTIY